MAGEEMTPDIDVDALLRRELSIEPSPEFLARVRERIGAEPQRSTWHWRVLLPASAAALCMTAIVLVAGGDPVTHPAAPPAPALSTGSPIVAHRPPGVEEHVVPPPAAVPAASRVAVARRDPEVIVDESQRAALAVLFGIIRDGRLTDQSFARTTPVSLQAMREGIAPVDVAPLAVSPIGVDGVLQKEKE